MSTRSPIVKQLPPDRVEEAVTVLSAAFHDYAAMRYVIGATGDAYDARLRTLIEYFVQARYWRDEPVLCVEREGVVAGVAIVTLPGDRARPPQMLVRRQEVWESLGADARERYERLSHATANFFIEAPHHHLNMIGVLPSHAGRRLGRRLLDAVHALANADTESTGVTLTTEDERNVALYEHVGYTIVDHARVSDTLETWGFYRPKTPSR